MSGLLNLFITPAIVSLLISLWAGRLMEERRARRDHITKLFESARDDVRRGLESGIDYFSTVPDDRAELQEARVLLADREIRSSISLLISRPRSTGCKPILNEAIMAYQSLISELTGGNFQSASGSVSKDHLASLVHAGAEMRTALAKLRDAELRDRSDEDPITKAISSGWGFVKSNNPFRDS